MINMTRLILVRGESCTTYPDVSCYHKVFTLLINPFRAPMRAFNLRPVVVVVLHGVC